MHILPFRHAGRLPPFLAILAVTLLACIKPEEPDTLPPEITITYPQHADTVSGLVTIECRTYDRQGTDRVELFVDGAETGIMDYGVPFQLEWNTLHYEHNKPHGIVVEASDASENVASHRIVVFVDNSDAAPDKPRILSVRYTLEELTLTWQASIEEDFQQYDLFHAYALYGEKTHVATQNKRDVTSHKILQADLSRDNWFWLKETNIYDISAWSDGFCVRDEPPTKKNITSIQYSNVEMIIQWQTCRESDFDRYRLYFSDDPNGEKTQITEIDSADIASYTLYDFDPTIARWYWLEVTDVFGNATMSDAYRVLNTAPARPDLRPVRYDRDSFILRWSRNPDLDISSHTIFESPVPTMDGERLIHRTTDPGDTTCTVPGVERNEYRYYQLEAVDFWGLSSRSEVRKASSYQKITYESIRHGQLDIMLMDISGDEIKNLTNSPDFEFNPTFSPDGIRIVHDLSIDFKHFIAVMDIDGSNNKILVEVESVDARPKYSPLGEKILFSGTLPNFADDNRQIIIMNTDGSELRRLTQSSWINSHPSFSPDGSRIVYQSMKSGKPDIYTMSTDGSDKQRLTVDLGLDSEPKYSPDGSKICFTSNRDGDYNIYLMNVDGSDQTRLTSHPAVDWHPIFSPDGLHILFESNRTGDYDLFLANIEGEGLVNLTESPGHDINAYFSTDGGKIVFQSNRDGNEEIYIMNSDGSGQINLTNDPAPDRKPVFEPTGQ